MDGLLGELAPTAVQDTREVRQAKEEFFTIFNSALNGIIETRFMRDTDEVRHDYLNMSLVFFLFRCARGKTNSSARSTGRCPTC